jgi:gliding motility-associated-like protein
MKSLTELSKLLKAIALYGMFTFVSFYAEGQGCNCPKITSCATCSGGLTSLTLKFNGVIPSLVTVSDQQGIVFTSIVSPGATFTFTGSIVNQKFVGTAIDVRIGFLLNAVINTNCSSSVFVGSTFGSFTVTAGESKNGGKLCCASGAMETVPPVIANCPTNIVVDIPTSACSMTVEWSVPIATDNCSVESFTSTHAPGNIFPLGVTPVTYTATDAYGNASACSFTVTVNDNSKPVFTGCPGNVIVPASSVCTAIATWTAPTASDNCTVSVLSNHNSGETFPLGTTPVTYTATDGKGNVSTCTFNVIVDDVVSPIITGCPSNIAITANSTSCNAVVSWVAPTASDNCSVTLTSNHNSGDVFPIGTTEVKYTATDQKGNVTFCTFSVEVQSPASTVITGCLNSITVNAKEDGKVAVTWDEPQASLQCGTLTTKKSHEPGSLFGIGTTAVVYEFTDNVGNTATCTLNVTVLEQEALINIAKVLTPDGDGINDNWMIANIENFKNNEVLVIDRWGNKVFDAAGYDNEKIVWNGTNKNGTQVPTGTYFYTVEVRLQSSVVKKTGYLEVIQ